MKGDKVYCYEPFFSSSRQYEIIDDNSDYKYTVKSPNDTVFHIDKINTYEPFNLDVMLEKMKKDYEQLEYDIEQIQKLIDKNTELNDDLKRNKNRRLKK